VPFSVDPAYLAGTPFPPEYIKALAARQPQVVYRLDAQRYVTLENYASCDSGALYYNDTAKGIRTQVAKHSGVSYEGKIINADPSGNNLVVPSVSRDNCDRFCPITLPYSTDAGRSFKYRTYNNRGTSPREDSPNYTIAATKDQIIVDNVRYPRGSPKYGDTPNVASCG